jgi:hypothetical protein
LRSSLEIDRLFLGLELRKFLGSQFRAAFCALQELLQALRTSLAAQEEAAGENAKNPEQYGVKSHIGEVVTR